MSYQNLDVKRNVCINVLNILLKSVYMAYSQREIGISDAPVCERSGQQADVFEFNSNGFFKLG